MKLPLSVPFSHFAQRVLSGTSAWLCVLALSAFALPNQASAAAFAATTVSPASQAANVGTPFSVNVVFAVGSYAAYGIDAFMTFDATKLQVVSVTRAASSPYTNVTINTFNNSNGTVRFQATGGTVANTTITVATIVFSPIAAGTANIGFSNVNEYIINYGPYGVNGLAVGGSVTITAPVPTQTLTILGGSGSAGSVAADTEYYNPATGQWQPAYLTGWHPWGFVAGTNSWINYKTNTQSDPGAGPTKAQTLWYLYRVRFTVPADAQNPTMKFSVKADNFAQVAINGVNTGPVIEGQADQVNADAVFSQNVLPGENTITLNVGDWGGLNGFNFRIDLTVQSAQPLEIIPADSDSTPPVISVPANITTEATGPAGAVVTFATSAVDDQDGPVAVLADPASGSTFPLGTVVVDLGASDSAGNMATASFHVTVRDTIAPVIAVPAPITVEATSAAGAVVTYAATAQDIVSGAVGVTVAPASGSVFPLGTTTVALGAGDAAGNAASASFPVTVQDTTPPVIAAPADITVEATSAAGTVVNYAATAQDIVNGAVGVTAAPASGSVFPLGTTTVALGAGDAAGNATSASFHVTVQDTLAPVITSVTPSTGTLWPPNHQMVPVTISVGATDATGVTSLKIIGVTSSEPDNGLGDGDTANDTQITGPLTVNLRAERSGKGNGRTYTITVEAKDSSGNVSTGTCTVFVPKSKGK